MRADYSDIFRDAAAVEKYDQVVFAPDTYASKVNARQRNYLRTLVRREFPHRRPVQHDFACGTGRSIRLLHGAVRAAHGYDTSPAMLARAHDSGVRASLHEVAETGAVPSPATDETPALVTVFRLLLNVAEPVRDRAIAFAALALRTPDAGLLIVENHGNARSIRHLRHVRRSGDPWFNELSHAAVEALLARHGFEVVARRGFALMPPGAYANRWLRWLASWVDDVAARVPLLSAVSTTVLYVARRTRQATESA